MIDADVAHRGHRDYRERLVDLVQIRLLRIPASALEHFPNREEMLASGAGNPAGRLVTPEDIAGVVSFLCSADAEMIRGQTVVIDGGWSLPAN